MTTTSKPTGESPGAKMERSASRASGASYWGWALVAVAAIIGGVVYWKLHDAPKSAAPGARAGIPPAFVTVATVTNGDVGVYVSGLGSVTPLATVSIKPRVDGELIAVNYQEGQLVNRGDPLVDIDPAPFQALLTQAQGQYDRDSALLENARLDLERYKEAFAKNAIPKQQLDTQLATVHQYEGTVKLDQGQIETAKVNLAYCHITAPVSGRVGLRLVDAGNVVHAVDVNPLVVIAQLEPITVTFGVDENYLPSILKQLALGRTLSVEAYDHEDTNKLTDGRLLTLDNQVDPNSGTVKFKALFNNQDRALFPNQFVNAHLLIEVQHGLVLPTAAIQRNAQGAFVYLIKPDSTKQGETASTNQIVVIRPVTVGASHGELSIVSDGVKAGDRVASDNFNRLQDGAKVVPRSGGGPRGSGEGGGGGRRGGGRRGGSGDTGDSGSRGGGRRGGASGDDDSGTRGRQL